MNEIYFTNEKNIFQKVTEKSSRTPDIVLTIDSKIKYQKHLGFGGALTDAACISFNYLNKENKENINI